MPKASQIEPRWLTPPEVAALWGVNVVKVLAFIRSGQLRAVNFASPGRNQRPRFKVHIDDIKDFQRRRQVQPKPKAVPRKRRERNDDRDYY